MTQNPRSRQMVPHVNGFTKTATPSDKIPASPTWPEICYVLQHKVIAFLEKQEYSGVIQSTQSHVRAAIGVIEEALRRYGCVEHPLSGRGRAKPNIAMINTLLTISGPEEISLSYNGGRDCLVLLVLILASLPASSWPSPTSRSPAADADHSKATSNYHPLQAIYIASSDPFPEVEHFATTSAAHYQLDLTRYALPMRCALEAYQGDRPAIKAIFMRTRRTDPRSEFLENFSLTDKDWPQLTRVNPVLDWRYAGIWAVNSSFPSHFNFYSCQK